MDSNKDTSEMLWKDVVKLFRKSNEVNQWGEYSHIKLYDDGSGDVVTDGDYDVIFSFHDLSDLVNKLRG